MIKKTCHWIQKKLTTYSFKCIHCSLLMVLFFTYSLFFKIYLYYFNHLKFKTKITKRLNSLYIVVVWFESPFSMHELDLSNFFSHITIKSLNLNICLLTNRKYRRDTNWGTWHLNWQIITGVANTWHLTYNIFADVAGTRIGEKIKKKKTS